MSGISKTIEMNEDAINALLMESEMAMETNGKATVLGKDLNDLITAYEQSQKGLEKMKVENQERMDLQRDASGACIGLRAELEKEQYDHQVRRCAHKADNSTYRAELEAANKRIGDLTETISIMGKGEQTDERR